MFASPAYKYQLMGTLVQNGSTHNKRSVRHVKTDCKTIVVKFKIAWAYNITLGYIYRCTSHWKCAEVSVRGKWVRADAPASGGFGRRRAASEAQARCRIDRRPRGAPLSAPRVATRTPGCALRRWRRERAPAASGGHAAMAREVTTGAVALLRNVTDWHARRYGYYPGALALSTSRPPNPRRASLPLPYMRCNLHFSNLC